MFCRITVNTSINVSSPRCSYAFVRIISGPSFRFGGVLSRYV